MTEVEIGWLLPDGRAGGRTPAGELLDLDRGVPGDRVAWRPIARRGRVIVGHVEAIATRSADRRTPPCAWTETCGGCDLADLAPDARHRALAAVVQRAFGAEVVPPVVPSPRPLGHRARIKLGIDGGRVGYRAARSHELVEIGTCAIARAEIQDAIPALRAALAGASGLGSVELRSDGHRVVRSFAARGEVSAATRAAIVALGDSALDGRTVIGDPVLQLAVTGHRLRASPLAFYQVNLEVNESLVAFVEGEILARQPERVLDLYAGIGNFTVPLAASGVPVLAVEAEGQSIADLRHNAAGLPVEVVQARLPGWDPSRSAFDAVVLDPPRAGAAGVLAGVLAQRPRAIAYVACDPVSGGRDVRAILREGYTLAQLRCFDLFPDTHHLETVAILDRAPSSVARKPAGPRRT